MARVRYSDGIATVGVDIDAEGLLRRTMERVRGGVMGPLEEAADAVAAEASARWYQQVDRRTGLTGQIEAFVTFYDDKVKVSVGSTDTRRDDRGRPIPVFVHTPGALSSLSVRTTKEEYAALRAAGVAHLKALWKRVPNPKAGSREFLLSTLVKKPFRERIRLLPAEIRIAISRRKR